MGSGEKGYFSFHSSAASARHGIQHHRREEKREVPKGCLAVLVGVEEEEELERFVVPVMYINHPLFMELLKEAEEEYGFDHKGPITIPCRVAEFVNVRGAIDREQHHHGHHHGHGGDHEHHHHFLCFKA
ncbi:hypothetical protein Droror1_Dr00013052 [Drosera rotundifolia]